MWKKDKAEKFWMNIVWERWQIHSDTRKENEAKEN